MKIGLFGGTFNPPHNSHIQIARSAKHELQLDELIVMPCGDPPHKTCGVDGNTRLELSRLAFGDFATVSDYEINKSGKSYTVETLEHLQAVYPSATLYLIIGEDSFRDIGLWYKASEIVRKATVVVAGRKGVKVGDSRHFVEKNGGKVLFLQCDATDVSSSEVRLRYDFDYDADKFVPPLVDEYIRKNGLYAPHKALTQKLKNYLKPTRFSHTFYVTERGLEFAGGKDVEKVFTACALHDVAKYVGKEDYAKYGFVAPEDAPEPVIHAFLGKNVALLDFGITDDEILDAIYYHTTARRGMTWLDKVVYTADKTERSRSYDVEHLLKKGNLDDIFVATLVEAKEFLRSPDKTCYYLTNEALDYYVKK